LSSSVYAQLHIMLELMLHRSRVPPLFLNAQTTRHEHLATLARDDPLIDRYHFDKAPEELPTWMLKTKKHRAGAHLLKHMLMITSVGSLGKGSYRWYAKNAR
jgi:hypothetical protein